MSRSAMATRASGDGGVGYAHRTPAAATIATPQLPSPPLPMRPPLPTQTGLSRKREAGFSLAAAQASLPDGGRRPACGRPTPASSRSARRRRRILSPLPHLRENSGRREAPGFSSCRRGELGPIRSQVRIGRPLATPSEGAAAGARLACASRLTGVRPEPY